MTEWWNSLDPMMKVMWGITMASSLVFIIQSIMTFVGADTGDTGLDADFDAPDGDMHDGSMEGGSNLLTFRNLVNFCLGFGWTAVLLRDQVKSTAVLMLFAVIIGVALVFAVMYLFKWLSSMQQSGNINVYKSAVGCQGKVYIPIPAERGGEGKVQITINDSVREYDALTDGDAIPTGKDIKVVEVINEHTLVVEEINSLII